MLEITNLEYAYDRTRALSVTFWKANQGEACLLHGQSDSGKSTLLHLLAGILRPQKGQLNVLGQDVLRQDQLKGKLLFGQGAKTLANKE